MAQNGMDGIEVSFHSSVTFPLKIPYRLLCLNPHPKPDFSEGFMNIHTIEQTYPVLQSSINTKSSLVNQEMIKMDKWEGFSCLGRAMATIGVVYFMPEIAKATGHGFLTLLFGGLAIFIIWVAGW